MSASLTSARRACESASEIVRTDPDHPVVALVRELVAALERSDYPAASRAKHRLRRAGWTVLPPPRWGRGGPNP